MNNKGELIEKIKFSLDVLDEASRDEQEFDKITAVFSIFHGIINLLKVMWDKEKIKAWKEDDDHRFYRFVSMLKMGLELQNNYLHSVSDQLIIQGNILSKKIIACQDEIEGLGEEW